MDAAQNELAYLGKSVFIKGEVSGSEDLYIDGEVEGSIDLRSHSVTIGPSGKVRASVIAKSIVVQGKVDGSISAADRLDLRKTAIVTGDVTTQRIAMKKAPFLRAPLIFKRKRGRERRARSGGCYAAQVMPPGVTRPRSESGTDVTCCR